MDLIPRARLTTQFLESNASTHESVFGAIAEIVDNAYDSKTHKLDIDVQHPDEETHMQGSYFLILRDYGCGMTASEIYNVIAYGWSNKTDDPEMIGMYGNGLKSGSMRVANDCLILSKKNKECSALMISQTFIKTPDPNFDNPDNEVICPLPSWRIETESSGKTTKVPIFNSKNDEEKEKLKHEMEVDLILQYSPFQSKEDLLAEFDSLDEHGTCIYLYQLQLNERGESELSIDHEESAEDIFDVGDHGDARSLRTYLSTLYLKPKMEIYLRQELIRPIRVQDLMYERRKYGLPTKKFRSHAKAKIVELKEKKKKIEMKLSKVKGKSAAVAKESGDKLQEQNKRIRMLNLEIEKYQTEVKRIESEVKTKERISEVKEFCMELGYNIRNRNESGLRIFNKNRLIVQIEGNSWTQWPLGVIACVNVPASLMQPSMSKQRFADEREFKTLQNLCLERAQDYAKRIRMEFEKWSTFGYPNSDPLIEREITAESEKQVNKALPKVYRCTECGQYRQIDVDSGKEIDAAFFICMENQDVNFNSCKKSEQKITTKLLELMPVIKREKESSDVEEVAVSPEKKRHKKNDKSNGTSLKRFVHDAPLMVREGHQNDDRTEDDDQDSSDSEPITRRRLRGKKRKSAFGKHSGNEVTSGFDRHRNETDDSDADSDVSDEPRRKTNNSDEVAALRKELEEKNKVIEDRDKKISLEQERSGQLTQEMKECIKTFYPTSWKDNQEYEHRRIDNWNYQKLRSISTDWKQHYKKDLKKVVESTKQKKALKTKIEIADNLQKMFRQHPDKMAEHLEKMKKDAKAELDKIEGKK